MLRQWILGTLDDDLTVVPRGATAGSDDVSSRGWNKQPEWNLPKYRLTM
jgi:hypothetical protein